MQITLLPAFADNYIFLGQMDDGFTFVVDPGDAAPVIDYLTTHGKSLHGILITHHHADHTGGLLALKERYGCAVYGPRNDEHRIKGIDTYVAESDRVLLNDVAFDVIETPGHTSGHICFVAKDENILFCGDTLFSLGCGRLFEGSPEQMFTSLAKLKALPEDTRVYCAHEYTLANLAFAKAYTDDPDYAKIEPNLKSLRNNQKPTIPSTIGFEKRWNPFFRCESVAAFAKMRAAKDSF